MTVTSVGQEPITYQWQKNGANIAGATTAAFEVESMTAVDSGAYRCIATNPLGSDTSSVAQIALKDQFITVISPNGGENGDAHVGMEIQWNSDIRGYNVSIDYSPDSGFTWASVVEQTEDDGEFLWELPFEINSEKAFIKITSSLDTTVFDKSDSIFKINIWGAITVIDSSSSSEKLLVYPNPVSVYDDAVQITVPVNLSGTGELTICDNLGATLDYQRFEFTNGATLSWDLCNSAGVKVASGSYAAVLQVTAKSGEVSLYKVLFGVEE